jgi:hypothetical protein
MYRSYIVWLGTWESKGGLYLNGFHVWDKNGEWVGVYETHSRARAHTQ